jgi:small GTP-binding protein
MNNNQYEFKVVVLGDKSVGKTCLVLRFIEGYFAAKQQSTIGAFFLTKKFTLSSGIFCKMQLWDTAGQERFRAMAPVREVGGGRAMWWCGKV